MGSRSLNIRKSLEDKMNVVLYASVPLALSVGLLPWIILTQPWNLGVFFALSVIAGCVITVTTLILCSELASIYVVEPDYLHQLKREKEKLRRRLTKVGREKQELLRKAAVE
jgi:hypothetical protein